MKTKLKNLTMAQLRAVKALRAMREFVCQLGDEHSNQWSEASKNLNALRQIAFNLGVPSDLNP